MKSKSMRGDSIAQRNRRAHGVYERIRKIIENARSNVARAINVEMVVAYWHVDREIMEEEQRGKSRAEYGQRLLETLAASLLDFRLMLLTDILI